MNPMRFVTLLGFLLLSTLTRAEWTEDADQCARLIGDNERAIRHCTTAVESGVLSREDLGQTYSNRAYLLWELERLDEALSDALQAAQLDDRNPTALNMVGLLYYATGKCGTALPWFEKALTYAENESDITDGSPAAFSANFNSVLCYESMGEETAARRHLRSAYELNPDHPDAQELYRKYGFK